MKTKEWILRTDNSIRATFWNETFEIEKFDENNSLINSIIISNAAFEEIMNEYKRET